MKPLTVLATGPNAAAAEFEPLRAAGLDLVIGRPLDAPDRRPWSEADLIEAVRAADIVLASHNIAHREAGRVANLKLALEQILALARGEVPAHVINPDAIARWRARRG